MTYRIKLAEGIPGQLSNDCHLSRELTVRVHTELLTLKTVDFRTLAKQVGGRGRIFEVALHDDNASGFHQFFFVVIRKPKEGIIYVASANYIPPTPPPLVID